MTRHTWRPGGATYYPMDGARQRDPLEPADVIAALDAMAQEIENLRAELDGRAPVSPTGHWSPWLEWRGGPCPLPGDAVFQLHGLHTLFHGACLGNWDNIRHFRYRADNPAGWLPRVEFIPPAELWDEDCPVRCEWKADTGRDVIDGDNWLEGWGSVTHIRLVAREAKAGLPEAQPEPGAVPELPEFVAYGEIADSWMVSLNKGKEFWISARFTPDDLDRIAEACTKLAARERARRAS